MEFDVRRAAGALLLGSLLVGLVLTGGLVPGRAQGQDAPQPMNRVSFTVERTRDVENDRITAVLGTTDEDPNPATLADRINKTMGQALETAKSAEGITVRSGGYQTYPVHEKSRIVRWRGSQNMILEGSDVDRMSQLIGDLQSTVQVQSVQFSVSAERRRNVEDELIAEALEAFKSRARLVRVNLDAQEFEIVQINVNTHGGGPSPVRGMARTMAAEVAAPSFEGGTSTLNVSVNATIELN